MEIDRRVAAFDWRRIGAELDAQCARQTAPYDDDRRRGDGVVFAVHLKPVAGRRGTYRVKLRHGVSRVRSGRRHAAGVIFHDAA